MTAKVCKEAGDDPNHKKRPAPHPGPRCTTCHRAFKKGRSARNAAKRLERVYGLTWDLFEKLWSWQGHKCAICLRPVRVRRPQVDHCHDTGVVRGLLCKPCNYDLLGRYSIEDLMRAAAYLLDPPAPRVIGRIVVPDPAAALAAYDQAGQEDQVISSEDQ